MIGVTIVGYFPRRAKIIYKWEGINCILPDLLYGSSFRKYVADSAYPSAW